MPLSPPISAADVLALEERALNAWPGLRSLHLGGWSVRFARGHSKRANSANALAPSAPFEEILPDIEALYARAGQPAIFRLSPLAPRNCDTLLEARGYRFADPSLVLTAPLRTPMDVGPMDVDEVAIATAPEPDWLDGFAAANAVPAATRAAHDEIVRAIAPPAAFATLRREGTPVAFGLAVRERKAVGLFDIVTAPEARGRGHGRMLAQALLAWGQAGGATSAYLQVTAGNEPALALYRRLGFTEAYRYHYRLPPP